MFTPHLPPEQAANALLPVMLAEAMRRNGLSVHIVAHPAPGGQPETRDVSYARRRGRGAFGRSPAGAVEAAVRMALTAAPAVRAADVVHLHSNGLIIEVGGWLAGRYGKPSIVTLYGTDVWDHDPVRHRRFGNVVRAARHRVFYSRKLKEFAEPLNLSPQPSSVVYAPVSREFAPRDASARRALRRELGAGDGPLLLTVKRLHPVAGYDTLLRAIPEVIRHAPDARLLIAGDGELRPVLEATTRELGVSPSVTFLGRIDHASIARYCAAADLFVLPSQLESWGTVMLEALASGTPVITTNTAGGIEVQEHFPEDVTVVERRNPAALAAAILAAMRARSRVSPAALRTLQSQFSVERCADAYLDIYRSSLGVERASER